jgi:acetyl esterase/lipase
VSGPWHARAAFLEQGRVLLALAAAAGPPALSRLALAAAGSARVDERTLGGAPATVFCPIRGRGRWPAALVVPGVTRAGRHHPALVRLGRGLAAAGYLVFVVEPEGLTRGELTPLVLERVKAAALAAAEHPRARGGAVALAGVSAGGTLALLAAALPEVRENVSAVVALAPCCDVVEAIRLVSTGTYRAGEAVTRYEPGDFFKLVIARSTVAWLEEGPDREALRDRLLALPEYGPDPLGILRSWPRERLAPPARAVVELLANRDPVCFGTLYAALPASLREAAEALSPVCAADRIAAPVELVAARADKYLPLADARAFAARCPRVRLTVLDTLAHAVPSLDAGAASDLLRLDRALVRALLAVRAASYSVR